MICQDDPRRALVRAHRDKDGHPDMNGLDYVEVIGDGKTLLVYFIGKLPKELQADRPELTKHVRIEGGRRVRDIQVLDVDPHVEQNIERDDYLIVTLDRPGDFSTYALRLVDIQGIDLRYGQAEFSFNIDCPSDLDCAAPELCPPPELEEPDVNYLAKDYASFRQLILDRLALVMPDWKERHVPDQGITLVELLAYVGDHLSYYQDAVATEAYLDTARQRISVRRHARLVDYFLHEGCNARAWVCLSIFGGSISLDLANTYFVTSLSAAHTVTRDVISEDELRRLPFDTYEIFEPMARSEFKVQEAHNEIHFHTWGQHECCLPRGTTSASLLDHWVYDAGMPEDSNEDEAESKGKQLVKFKPVEPPPLDTTRLKRTLDLQVGDVLIFEERIGPRTGNPADADPARRCAVRLVKVTPGTDPVIPSKVNANGTTYDLPTPVVDIEWAAEDALPFALCLSAIGPAPDCEYLEPVSVACGNVILVDQGRTVRPPEGLGMVPVESSEAQCECIDRAGDVVYLPGRFRPRLERRWLTHRQPLPPDDPQRKKWVSARGWMAQDPRAALPQIWLSEVPSSPDDGGDLAPLFELDDLTDPVKLIERMRDPDSHSGAMLRWKLSHTTRKELEKLNESASPGLIDDVREDLETLLRTWVPRFDLLHSGPDDLHFVVEVDNEGAAHLRFGDGELGEQPPAGSAFYAAYRVGNGARGNVGADSITHIVQVNTSLSGVSLHARNPLPAAGGTDPEPIADAKLYAPFGFRSLLARAIIADDYARLAEQEFSPALQCAAAQLVWTGSWYEAVVALDMAGGHGEAGELIEPVGRFLEHYRRMGHDLRVGLARYAPLDIELVVCVKPGYLRGHVKASLLNLFGTRALPGGKQGFFHPDRFSFGDSVYLSQIVAAAQTVEGVESADVTVLKRRFEAENQERKNGVLPLDPFEVAQVDNDPAFPENGRFTLVMSGGR